MSDYSINTVIQNYFEQYHKDLTVLNINVQKIRDEYKKEHPRAKFEVEVTAAYPIEDILLALGYEKEEIEKNKDNDTWLTKVEHKQ